MDGGVSCDPQALEEYQKIKMNKAYRYVTFKIDGEVKVDLIGERQTPYEQLLTILPDNEPRYIVLDFDFHTKDGRDVEYLTFIFWCPDNTPVKKKLTYATTKEGFKAKCQGIFRSYEAQDLGMLEKKVLIHEFDK